MDLQVTELACQCALDRLAKLPKSEKTDLVALCGLALGNPPKF